MCNRLESRKNALLMPIAVLAAGMGHGVTAAPAQVDQAAPAKEVVAQAIKAMGGAEAIAKIDSMRTVLELEGPMGAMGIESFWARTGEVLIKQQVPGMGEMSMGYDGEVGWSSNPMGGGYMLLDEKMTQQMLDQGAMHIRLLQLQKTMEKEFTTIENMGTDEFGDRQCHKLKVQNEDEERPASGFVFFDAETHLPAGMEMTEEGPQGATTSTVFFKEWTPQAGVQFYREMLVSAQGMEMSGRYTEIELNKVDKKVFELPAEVKELVAAKAAGPEQGEGEKKEKSLDDFSPQQQEMIKSMLESVEKITDVDQLKQMLESLESQIGAVPADHGEAIAYVVEAVKERIKTLGGNS
jgi:hypothetical protein